MTDIITFSGVHGSGKTTIINDVANRLTNIGKRVFVLQEFPYIPDISIGTMDFQAWYYTAMEQRSLVVRRLMGMFDVILLDRHPLDVDVYTSRLLDSRITPIDIQSKVQTMSRVYLDHEYDMIRHWKEYTAMFLLERPYEDLKESIRLRQMAEGHRKDWNEDDGEYLMHIINTFRYFKENPNVTFIENKVLDDTKDLVFEHIIQRLNKNE